MGPVHSLGLVGTGTGALVLSIEHSPAIKFSCSSVIGWKIGLRLVVNEMNEGMRNGLTALGCCLPSRTSLLV